MGYGSKDWQDWVLAEEKSLPLIEQAYDRGINTMGYGTFPCQIPNTYIN